MDTAQQTEEPLPLEAVSDATRQARRDGIFAGAAAGLAATILGSNVFKFNRNTTIFCGLLTGALSGHQFTQGFTSSNMARLRAEIAAKRANAVENPDGEVFLQG